MRGPEETRVDVVGRHGKLVRRTALISGLTLVSRVIGFVRESLAAALFGDRSAINDAFVTAWRVPNLFRSLMGEGAISTAMQGALTRTDHERGEDAGRRLFHAIARTVFWASIALCVVGVLVVLALPDRMPLTGWAWLGEDPAPVRELTARMLPFVVFVCLAAVAGGALQVRGHFLAPAAAPAIMNVCWIAALIAVAYAWGWHSPPEATETQQFERQFGMARALALFVLGAGAVLFLVHVPALASVGLLRRTQRHDAERKPATTSAPSEHARAEDPAESSSTAHTSDARVEGTAHSRSSTRNEDARGEDNAPSTSDTRTEGARGEDTAPSKSPTRTQDPRAGDTASSTSSARTGDVRNENTALSRSPTRNEDPRGEGVVQTTSDARTEDAHEGGTRKSSALALSESARTAGPAPRVTTREVWTILRDTLPLAFGAAVYQINVLVSGFLAEALLPDGGPSALYYASRLQQLPLSLVSVAATSAVFPMMTALGQTGDRARLRRLHDDTHHAIAFVALPATLGLLALAGPICAVCFQHGAFGVEGVERTAAALRWLTLAILPAGAAGLVARAYYAVGDYATPVRIAAVLLAVNTALNVVAIRVFGMDADGLAMATAVCAWVNLAWLLPGLGRKLGGAESARETWTRLGRVLALSALSAAAAWGTYEGLNGGAKSVGVLVIAILAAVGVYAAGAAWLRIPEWRAAVSRFRKS